jgi:hypothetical protein
VTNIPKKGGTGNAEDVKTMLGNEPFTGLCFQPFASWFAEDGMGF